MDIPVFHDDQHGTAIIAAAGMINAIHLTGRDIKTTRLVCNGAGAAGIACLDLIKAMGFEPSNVILCDTKGVVYRGREDGMNQWKSAHAVDTPLRTLAEAMVGADIFFGLSAKGALTPEMVKSMAPNPIIFAMANPDPEITPEDAQQGARRRHHRHRPLGLSQPGQQRPRLSLHLPRRARRARQDHQHGDEDRRRACAGRTRARGRARRSRGRLSRRAAALRPRVHHSGAVRSAPHPCRADRGGEGGDGLRASRGGRSSIMDAYKAQLSARRDPIAGAMQRIIERVRRMPKRVVFAEGEEEQVIRAAYSFVNQGLGTAILVGREDRVRAVAAAGRPRSRRQGHRDPQRAAFAAQRALCAVPLRAAAAARLPAARLPAPDQPGPQLLRRRDGRAGRRRRDGDRRHAQFLDRARGSAARHRRQAGPSRHRRLARAGARPPGRGRRHRDHRNADAEDLARDRDRGGGRRAPARLRAARGDARLLQFRPSAGRARAARAGGGAHSRRAARRFRVRRRNGRRRRAQPAS